MSDNTSKTQHITELDFDIAKALQQLNELSTKFNSISDKISNTTIPISLQDAFEAKDEISKLKGEIDSLNKKIDDYKKQAQAAGESTDYIAQRAQALTDILTYKLVNAFEEMGRAAYEAVKSTEDSMVEISRVIGLTSADTENMRSQLFGLGQDFGRSFEDVSAVALKFAQSGNNMQESIENTRAMLLALNTAELDVENGTQSLIGIMSQWNMEASDLTTIIDKLNYTADNNAVTTQDLVDGLLKASSMAKTAGMSFDDTVGILTSLKVASGAAGKEVGNAFKSIMAYIQRPKSLDLFDEMGIEVYADKLTGELLPMMTILENMTKKWNSSQKEMLDTLIESGDAAQMMSEEWAIAANSMDEYTDYQNAMAEATDKANTAEARAQAQAAAGVYRRNYYISLMENFSKAMEVSKDLVNAEGHSMEENSRYMETLTAKTEQLVVSLTELAVTAADAGLLELAKSTIDTATAITKCTSESNALLPILSAAAGILITIKAQQIADEFISIGGAFKNAGASIKSAALGIESAKASMGKAKAEAQGLSSALGGIGLAITGSSLVIGVVNSITAAIQRARQEAIDAGTETKNQIDEINNLYQQFEELRGITERTTEQDNEYKKVQKEIRELLQGRTDDLKGLTLGTEAYASALEVLVNEERKLRQSELDNATDAAKKEMGAGGLNLQRYKSLYEKTSNSRNSKADYDIAQSLLANGYATAANDNSFSFSFSNDTIKNFTNLKSAMELLNEEHSKLIESGKIEEAEAYSTSNAYKNVEAAYEKCRVKVETYVKALVAQKENEYIIQNGLPKTYAEQVKMNDVIFIRTGLTDDYRDSINELIPLYFTAADAERDFMEALSSSDVEQTIISMAKAGTLTDTIFSEMLKSNSDLSIKMREVGLTSADAVKFLNESYQGYNNVADSAKSAGEQVEDFAKVISSTEKNISSLNGYIQTLNEGNGLTADQVLDLCDTYGLLADQFTLTEKGYTIEVSALEKLRDEQIKTAVTARLEQAGYTEEVVANILKRIQAYSDEVKGISSVADAQLALEKLKLQLSDAQSNVHISSSYEAEQYGKQVDDLRELIGQTEGYAETLEYLDKLQNDLYQNLGKSFGDSKKGADDADDGFKSLVESIERLGEMGVYSLQETIDKFEELRRTAGLTEEQIKTVEDNLHELYSSQIEEHLKAAEQEKKDYIDSVKEKYDEDKEALKKLLDDEKEKFKEQQEDELDARKKYWEDELDNLKDNLNEQINASKKAYESKKKLYEKSYDNQKEALERLRDLEIDSINESYNARIDALEKIKAARQAERDDEDYQDERNELLEQISYWEQRTGTDAVENLEKLKKELADLDKQHKRDVEDRETDNEIDDLEKQRDEETAAVKAQYDAQIAALESAKKTELEIYESTYNAEQEMLKAKLEKDVKAMEEARDADLKTFKRNQKQELNQLEEQQEKRLKDLEDEKDAAIKAAEDKWKRIEQIFNDSNIAMIASAGIFANDLYDQFNREFTKNFEMDLDHLSYLISSLNSRKSSMEGKSGKTPSDDYKGGGSSGSGNSSGGNSSKKKKKKDDVVGASTGGKTTADGLVMLHKNELIINPPTTKKLEDLLVKFAPLTKVDTIAMQNAISRYWGSKAVQGYSNTATNIRNNYSNSTNNDNSRQVVNNFNAPLQNIEKIEDAADMEAATNAIERKIMRELSTKL